MIGTFGRGPGIASIANFQGGDKDLIASVSSFMKQIAGPIYAEGMDCLGQSGGLPLAHRHDGHPVSAFDPVTGAKVGYIG